MKKISLTLLSGLIFLTACSQKNENSDKVIANGHMPAIAKDKENNIHIVYGNGDSILYVFSKAGKSYSTPTLVAVLPELAASATSGPQIDAVSRDLFITVGDNSSH
mgnify:CR=1 FL=1